MTKLSDSLFEQSKQDLERISRIFNVLVKFQVGPYVDRVMRSEKLPIRIRRRRKESDIEKMSAPERLTLMLEELGPSFVKFGQLLATRNDIVGPDYASKLSKLQDNMKSFSSKEAKQIINEDLGKPVSELFSSFEDEPVASASIAQVHRATLKNGKKVVVKVQRPGIEKIIKEDIRIMHYLAYLAAKNIPEIKQYDPQYLIDEFEKSIMKELDFEREANNLERFRDNFKGDKGIYVPTLYPSLSSSHVITMEEIKGTKLTDIVASKSKKINKKLVAQRCLKAYFQMILVDGFYHADPHPGNIMVLNKNVVCFLDFGRCATIDRELSGSIFQLVLFAAKNDVNGLISQLLRANLIDDDADLKNLKADLTDLLDKFYSPEIKNIQMGQLLSDLMSVIRKYDFNRPRELAELTRTLLILEGVGEELDPSFNVAEELEPYSSEYLAQSITPEKIEGIIRDNLLDLEYVIKDFPGSLRKFIKKVSEGRITLQLEHKNLDVMTANIKDMTDRLSVALIIAALIVASAMIGLVNSSLGLLFFVLSSALGIWLVLKTLFL